MICALFGCLMRYSVHKAQQIAASPTTQKVIHSSAVNEAISATGSGIKYGIYGAVDGSVAGMGVGAYSAYSLFQDPELRQDPSRGLPYAILAAILCIGGAAGGAALGGSAGFIYGVGKRILSKH
jgi:hypothetical protein